MTPEELLNVLLSNKQPVSSSTNQRLPSTHNNDPRYRCIGAGSCGVIYECTGTTFAFKLARNDNPQLWNDFKVHSRVVAVFTEHHTLTAEIHVPRCKTFIRPDDDDWWADNLPKFPAEVQATKILCTERICPLPKPIRDALVMAYSPTHLQPQARTDILNADCLARIYLGRRRRTEAATTRRQRFFTLRNFPLHLDQMLDLDLDIDTFARNMAAALAVMHWAARIDADDVEFVLGSRPTFSAPVCELDPAVIWAMPEDTSTLNLTNPPSNFRPGQVHMWLLDFNLCGTISMDEAGVEKAVKAFYKNDPYFPRPLAEASRDQQLWGTFCREYLRASEKVLADGPEEVRGLPGRFIENVIAEQQARLARRAEETSSSVPPVD